MLANLSWRISSNSVLILCLFTNLCQKQQLKETKGKYFLPLIYLWICNDVAVKRLTSFSSVVPKFTSKCWNSFMYFFTKVLFYKFGIIVQPSEGWNEHSEGMLGCQSMVLKVLKLCHYHDFRQAVLKHDYIFIDFWLVNLRLYLVIPNHGAKSLKRAEVIMRSP